MRDDNLTTETLISLEGLDTYHYLMDRKKVDKIDGKGLSTNDFSNNYKAKLDGIESGAEVNVQADWNQTIDTADDFIKNKPTLITYTLTQDETDGHILTFTPSSGTVTTITIPDNDHTYSNLNEFSNEDTKFITNAVNDLVNYYKKSETYTQAEVNSLISTIPKFKIEVVDSLLIPSPSTSTIYLLLNTSTTTQNLYTEYIYIIPETGDPFFEKLGEQTIDLDNYYTKSEVNALLDDKVNIVDIGTAASKGVDTSISDGSTSPNLPTSEAVAAFVEGKGYVTTDNDTTYSLSPDTVNNKITLTPSSGNPESITVPYATNAGNAATVNGKTVETSVPANAVFTDTTYSNATQSADGLMSSIDKTKLDGIATGAEVNQNSFSNVKVGDSIIEADDKTDTLELVAGSNVQITPDATNDKVTISATDTTYSDATQSVAGLMSSTDKTKLDGIATGAEVNQNAFSNVKIGDTIVEADSKTDTLEFVAGSNITITPDADTDKITITATDTTYSNATQSVSGLMSSTDKTKLDSVETGAEVNQNSFSNVKIGSIVLEADSKTDTVELIAGTNITLTPDATNDSVTIIATDTTYSDATTSTSGLMSGADKTKLDGIATGAEVNQNAFSSIDVTQGTETTNISADAKTDKLTFVAGSNVTLTPDATNDKITIAATDTTYSDATTSASGLMSATDKTKLNGVATGAEVNQNAFSNVKIGNVTIEADAKTDTLELIAGSNVSLTTDAANDKITITATDTTYSNATQSTAGLMSATDKTKLDGIATGATANTGTVTSVATGAGLVGGTITGSGTIKANLKSETASTLEAADMGSTADRQYAVGVDKNGKLSVNIPWSNSGGTVTSVKVGSTSYNPSSGVVSLPAYPTTLPASDTTDSYSSTGTTPVSGKAVNAALQTLDVSGDSTVAANKTIASWSETDGKVNITTQNISITKSQVSDFPTLGNASGKNYTTSVTKDSTDLVTSGAVWSAIDNLPEPMVFKGSLGTGGTITALPVDGTASIGDTYKVITAGTYASKAAKIGDTFVCLTKTSSANTWELIPSGDEPNGTVTSVGVSNGGGLSVSGSPITTSGTITISHADTSSQASVNNSGRTYIQDITLDGYGHVTGIASATETVTNTDRYVNSASFANDDTNSNVKMTLTRAGSDSATVTANIPKVSSSSAGVVPKGAAVSSQSTSTKFLREDGSWAAPSYIANTDRYVNSAGFAYDSTNDNVKMTLTRAGSDTATVTGNIPKISSSTAGVVPKGAAVSSQSQSTKFLREDGSWAAPSYTTNTNTTYTIATGDSNGQIKVTPSSGSAYNVSVKGLGNAAYATVGGTVVKANRGSSMSTSTTGCWTSMCNSGQTGSPTLPTASKWWHVLSMDWSDDAKNWVSQLAVATQDGSGVWWRKNDASGTDVSSSTWHRLAEGDADGNATNANKVNNLTVQTAVPANAVFTDTDTKVTSVGNHYAPTEDANAKLSADASSSTAATWNSTSLVTGVDIKRDAKGHVVGVAVDSIKMPANPNTNTTYTFANGTNGFTVTPSGGSAQTVTVTPSITNNVTGSGTSGYIAKFNGANTITNGPAFGSATNTWLRNDGAWATPPDTNTWRGIQDNLTSSTNTTESLSAKQGYLLANGSARDSTKVAKTGDNMTGGLNISHSAGGNYNEGLRLNKAASNSSATLVIGGTSGSTTGISDGAFWIGAVSTSRKLWITHNSSTDGQTFFYSSSSTDKSPSLQLGGELKIGGNSGPRMQYNATNKCIDFVFA